MTSPELPLRPQATAHGVLAKAQTDWDNPSSHTGTVKRRPQSIAEEQKNKLKSVHNQLKLKTFSKHQKETKKPDYEELDFEEVKIPVFQTSPKVKNSLKNKRLNYAEFIPTSTGLQLVDEDDGLITYDFKEDQSRTLPLKDMRRPRITGSSGDIFLAQKSHHIPDFMQMKSTQKDFVLGYQMRSLMAAETTGHQGRPIGLAIRRDTSCQSFSDADSGFLSPASPAALELSLINQNVGGLLLPDPALEPGVMAECDGVQFYVKVATLSL